MFGLGRDVLHNQLVPACKYTDIGFLCKKGTEQRKSNNNKNKNNNQFNQISVKSMSVFAMAAALQFIVEFQRHSCKVYCNPQVISSSDLVHSLTYPPSVTDQSIQHYFSHSSISSGQLSLSNQANFAFVPPVVNCYTKGFLYQPCLDSAKW